MESRLMPLKTPYKIVETLHENASTLIQRAQYANDSKDVILKTFKSSKEAVKDFFNERKILSTLHLEHIPKLIDSASFSSENINIFEDIGGDSLFNVLSQGRLTIPVSLDISFRLAKTLHCLHQNNILHADINPHNIIYNTQTKALELINFTKSCKLSKVPFSKEKDHISVEGMLYTSPEQTGLTKQKADLRSDLFSLGMTLYHLFLGRPPFEASDRYELTHKLIAYTPEPLHKLDPEIPSVLSNIIQKLMQKKPESRYQSDEALINDLDRCIHSIDKKQEIPDFEIATHDPKELKIGKAIFGRDKEISLLKKSADKAFDMRSCKMLVSGSSGVGKTRLMEEYFTFFDPDKTAILRAKFDQYQKPIPYASFKQLFLQVHTRFLSKGQPQNRTKVSKKSAAILNFVFPELRDFFPSRSENILPSLSDMNVQLSLAVKDFFMCLAFEDSPLIIFIDDLQWADAASVTLLQQSVIDIDNPYLHFIGSFRDIEIENNKTALKLINDLQASRHNVVNIRLSSLEESDLKKMLKSLFSNTTKSFSDFVSVIYKRTDGNPFFVKSFIQHLIDEKDLYLENGRWEYSLEKIKAHGTSVNIANIITTRFNRLNKSERSYLQYLSLLGNHLEMGFCLEVLSSLGYKKTLMYSVQDKGFVDQIMGKCQFTHDQIQSFVYASIDEKTKRKIHLSIGRYFEAAYKKGTYSDIIPIANHLNNAYLHDKLPARLFKLNVQALEEMVTNNDYTLALKQIRWVKTHLYDEQLWEKERSTAFRFAELECRGLYLNALHDMAFTQIKQLIQINLKCSQAGGLFKKF